MKGIFVKVTFGDYGKHYEFKTDTAQLLKEYEEME